MNYIPLLNCHAVPYRSFRISNYLHYTWESKSVTKLDPTTAPHMVSEKVSLPFSYAAFMGVIPLLANKLSSVPPQQFNYHSKCNHLFYDISPPPHRDTKL